MTRYLKRVVPVALAAGALPITSATATAPPVGPLPTGAVVQVTAPKGSLVAVALPHRSAGLVWRLARKVDPSVLREDSEADVGNTVVVIFRTVGAGDAKVVFALTRGERTHAFASVTHVVHVRAS